MDNFMNLAQQGLAAYQRSQSDVSKTGGSEYNSPDNSGQDDHRYGPNINHDEAVQTAQRHGSGHADLFSSALGYLGTNKQEHSEPVDEQHVIQAHDQVYGSGNTSDMSAKSIGSAAALQVMKRFTSGSSNQGGGTQTQLISLAMAEATKMFDKFGGNVTGNKQDAVNGAAMTVMKLLVQSKLGGGSVMGGSNSGGLGGLMSLATKFA